MTDTKRWLDELPHGAPERDLLLAGRAVRPPFGSVDEGWQALGVALGATTVTTAAAAANGVIHAAAGTTNAGAASHAATAGSFAVAVKYFVTGVALFCGVSGAVTVAGRVSRGYPTHESSSPVAVVTESKTSHAGVSRAARAPLTAPPSAASIDGQRAAAPIRATESGTQAAPAAVRREPPARQAESGAVEPSSAPSSPELALSAQARELAEVKRLIDAGEATPALARLDAGARSGGALVLSEERDALYVQALAAARRQSEARARARAFRARYPESPYLAAMRGLLTNE